MPSVSESFLVAASPQTLFNLLSDFRGYVQLFEQVKRVKIVRKGEKPRVSFDVELIQSMRYLLDFSLKPPKKISWSLVESSVMTKNSGSWKMANTKRKGETKLTYTIDVEISLWVPEVILKSLIASQLPQMLEAVKSRAEKQ